MMDSVAKSQGHFADACMSVLGQPTSSRKSVNIATLELCLAGCKKPSLILLLILILQ